MRIKWLRTASKNLDAATSYIGLNEKYKDNQDTKEAKMAKKSIYDEKIMLDVLNNIEENYLKYGKVKI